MQHLLLVGVLHGVADHQEQLDALLDGERLLAAVLPQRLAVDQLHHEVGEPARGRARVHQPRDARVVHPVQRLSLGREPLQDLSRVHARVEDLDRDGATDGPLLLGPIDGAEAAAPDDLLEHVVVQLARQRVGVGAGRGRLRAVAGRLLQHPGCRQPGAQRARVARVGLNQRVERSCALAFVTLEDLERRRLELVRQGQVLLRRIRHGHHHDPSRRFWHCSRPFANGHLRGRQAAPAGIDGVVACVRTGTALRGCIPSSFPDRP